MLTETRILTLSVEELEEEIQKHNQLYWRDDAAEISDALYDLLVERLKTLDPTSDILRELGSDALGDGPRVEHEVPMLSLEKCYTETELHRWFDRFEGDAVVTAKIDGVALSLRYDARGQLQLGVTRGDGVRGERITENARSIIGVPERIAYGPLEVRGEAYMPLDTFNEQWAESFANPRNLAAGALKLKDPEGTARYGVHFFAYEAHGLNDIYTDAARFDRLKELGFSHVPYTVTDKAGAQAAFDAISDARASLNYETDGVVFRVNDIRQHEAMGRTAHHPRFAIAYKFQGESGFSVLRDIEWNVSRTGKINPIAIIDAVSLSGVTVRRVSLHNLGIMERLGAGAFPALGSKVLVTRRGGVIPHIESVAVAGDTRIELPERCPSCGAPTRREDDTLVADHTPECASAALKSLEHFSAVADIRGLGPKVLAQLFEAEFVREPADIYLLTKEELLQLERTGERSADNLLKAIDDRRVIRASTFLTALGIRELGGQVALALEATFDTWEALVEASPEQLTAIDGIGETIAQSVVAGLEERRSVVARLRQHVALEWPDAAPPAEGGPLQGVAVVFTGAMETMGRKEAQAFVAERGGSTPSAVSAKVRYLVIGGKEYEEFLAGKHSSKARTALKLQDAGVAIEILSEQAFLARIEGESTPS